MHKQIDEKTLAQLAKLANLSCSFQELQNFSSDLERIATHFDSLLLVQIEELHQDDGGEEIIAPLRDDLPESFDNHLLLKLAPERIGDLYRVPPVLKQELSS